MDSDRKLATPLYTWADTRSADATGTLSARSDELEIHKRTGCHLHSSYWPAKLLWMGKADPHAFERTAKWLSFSDLLHFRLTGDLTTSVSMASGTGLFDQRRCYWDEELAGVSGISAAELPEIAAEDTATGLSPEFRKRWPAFAETKWLPAIGDGAANNIGAGCVGPDRAALMVGTSAAIRVLYEGDVPEAIPEGLFCYRLDRKRIVLGGALSDGGSLYRWLTETLGLNVDDASLEERYRDRPPGHHGLTFLPFVFGERSTGYHAGAKGAVIGITRGTDAADIALAAMEGIAFRLAEIMTRMERVTKPKEIVVSGGAIENSAFLAQLVADVLGRDVLRTKTGLASLRGAALFAIEATGFGAPALDKTASPLVQVQHDQKRHRAYLSELEKHRRFYQRNYLK